MPKIFWKVFLWFWLTMLIATVATFWLGNMWLEKRDVSSRHMAHLESLAASAESILEEGGKKALKSWIRHVRKRTPFRILVVDTEEGETLRGRHLPSHLKAHMKQALGSDGAVESEFEEHRILSLPIGSLDGGKYRLITEMPGGFTGMRDHRMGAVRDGVRQFAGSRMLIAFAISALICLMIAYFLVRPIRQMQQAARSLGEGDLSARTKLGKRRDEIGDLAREFDEMASRIETMVQSQQRLLRDVSHELRSPLARLQVALELARKRTGNDAEAELDRIDHEARQVDLMIGDMLTLVRLESGESRGEDVESQESVELNALLASVVSDANYEFAEQQKKIELLKSIPATIFGNASLIRSAIENVVRNAMKYTPADTVVDIRLKADAEDQIKIEIRDYGEGVSDENLSRLFDPFYRVGEARDRQSGGFGLGLSIAARVIRSHGGSIHAENAEGGGLLVIITLPCSGGDEKRA
jgi:two-component system sensor histidine kinase CpxA